MLSRIHLPGLACLLGLPMAAAASNLAPLAEDELAQVSGGQGILLSINLRNNVAASGAPIGCTAVVNTPNPCRFGLEFAARNGTWLMLKDYYGTFRLTDLRLDIGFLPTAATGHQNGARFEANGGSTCASPLVPGCHPGNRPAVLLSYPGADAPATYDDFHSFLNIGRAWLEFDAGGIPGYQRDTSLNSVFGVRMSDSTALNQEAHMRFRGTAYVYGF